MKRILLASLLCSVFGLAHADASPQAVAVLQTLKEKYPNTTFKEISTTEIPGVYEVVMGKNVAYVDETGRYFLFGHMFDMKTQTDLTEPKLAKAVPNIPWSSLKLENAVVTVKGNGKRKLAVFSDPDCPFCKRVETTLAGIKDVTIYTFLMPLAQLHPGAPAKSQAVWCAKDKAAAWSDLMLKGIVPTGTCPNPIEENLQFAARNEINGTPTLIFQDGSMVPGAVSAERIESMLARGMESAK